MLLQDEGAGLFARVGGRMLVIPQGALMAIRTVDDILIP